MNCCQEIQWAPPSSLNQFLFYFIFYFYKKKGNKRKRRSSIYLSKLVVQALFFLQVILQHRIELGTSSSPSNPMSSEGLHSFTCGKPYMKLNCRINFVGFSGLKIKKNYAQIIIYLIGRGSLYRGTLCLEFIDCSNMAFLLWLFLFVAFIF